MIPPKPPLPAAAGASKPAAGLPDDVDDDAAVLPDLAAGPDAVADPEPVADAEPVADPDPEPEPEPEPEASESRWFDPEEDSADARDASEDEPALVLENVVKRFGTNIAVDDVSLRIERGTFFGLVGPNGAGKTTTLSMIAGLLRPDAGTIRICGTDARVHEREAKRLIGVLPDRLRTFDRLTGRQLLTYAGLLRGLEGRVVEHRVDSLARALDLEDALGRIVADYSAGMTKKVMLAAAMIHAPRLLVLDEPFEALDPASAAVILDILRAFTAQGGTVVLSSHGMDLIERVCDRVAVLAAGRVLAAGAIDEVRGGTTLAERFVEIVGGAGEVEGLEWLHTSSD